MTSAIQESFLSRFEIGELLHQGAKGLVHLARDKIMDTAVWALKSLPRSYFKDIGSAARFLGELHRARTFNHTNILGVYAFAVEGEYYFYTTEYFKGVLLEKLLESGPLTVPAAAEIMLQVGVALYYLNCKGVHHESFSERNILVDAENRVKLVDAGISYAHQESPPSFPTTPPLAGLAAVMAGGQAPAPPQYPSWYCEAVSASECGAALDQLCLGVWQSAMEKRFRSLNFSLRFRPAPEALSLRGWFRDFFKAVSHDG